MVEKTAKQIEFEKAAESLTAPDKEFVSTTEGGVPVTKAEEIISSNRAFQKKLTDPLLAPFQMIGNLVSPGQPFGQKNPYVATQEVQDARADELLNMKLHRENKEKVRGEVAALIKDVEDQLHTRIGTSELNIKFRELWIKNPPHPFRGKRARKKPTNKSIS